MYHFVPKSRAAFLLSLLVCLSALLFLNGCGAWKRDKVARRLEAQSTNNLKSVLKSSGKNRQQLERFLDSYPAGSQKARDARFLVSNLPPADRASMQEHELSDVVDYARLAQKTLSWGDTVPEHLFRHYVLPHRVSQEPYQQCRPAFYKKLAPMVANSTARQAVERINRWCRRKTRFEPTTRWDQGPLTTIKRGFGRCEEQVVLFVLALRSVGIPARPVGTPAWQHTNGNHLWTEVWIRGEWIPLDAAQPYQELTENRYQAPIVRTVAFGGMSEAREQVISREFGSAVINRTPDYLPSWELKAQVVDQSGDPLPDAEVFVSVFNFGCFQPVARLETSGRGRASVDLGQGSFLLTVRHENRSDSALVSNLEPNKRRVLNATLDLRKDRQLSGRVHLRFYSDTMKQTLENGHGTTPFPAIQNSTQKSRDEKRYARRFRNLELLMENFSNAAERKDIFPILNKARLNAPELATALESTEQPGRSIQYLRNLAAKDLVAASPQQAVQGPLLADKARGRAMRAGLRYDNSTYRDFVLNPRVEYEPLTFWRSALRSRFKQKGDLRPREALREINRYAANLEAIERGYLGPVMSPGHVLRAGAATEKSGYILACSALRAMGIPARYNPEWDFVEYKLKQGWKPLFPDHPERLGQRNATRKSKRFYSPPAKVRIRFKKGRKRLTGEELDYFRDFSIARYTEKGYFHRMERSLKLSFPSESTDCEVLIPPGDYWIFAAERNSRGEPSVSVATFQAKPEEQTTIQMHVPE